MARIFDIKFLHHSRLTKKFSQKKIQKLPTQGNNAYLTFSLEI